MQQVGDLSVPEYLTRWLREQGLDARYVEIDNPI